MPLYTKRPVTIEARQWDGSGDSAKDILVWIHTSGKHTSASYHDELPGKRYLRIQTLAGILIAHAGDYIIKGIRDEFYPCAPDIFIDTYKEAAA